MNGAPPVVRAIDVGYGNTKFTLSQERSARHCAHFPSRTYPSLTDNTRDALAGRRKTVAIPLNGVFYEVGPDIALAGNPFRGSHGHDGYIDTPEYLALMRGAIRYMKVDHIDLLVVGLPVALLATKRAALEKLATGQHEIAPGQYVTVRKALAVAQPQGALAYYGAQAHRPINTKCDYSLVIDAGYRTFDWLVAHGLRLVSSKSHSVNCGMLDMIKVMCQKITSDRGIVYRDIDALDCALRTRTAPTIARVPYGLEQLTPIMSATARQAVSSMVEWLGDTVEFDHIIVVGGASSIYLDAVRRAFPGHKVHQIKDPLYANVKGYLIAGLDWIELHASATKQNPSEGREAAGPRDDSPTSPPQEPMPTASNNDSLAIAEASEFDLQGPASPATQVANEGGSDGR